MQKNNIIKSIIFCCIICLLLIVTSKAFLPKDNSIDAGMIECEARGFYSENSNTIETFFIGDSNAFAGFSPMLLWNKFGYTSYVAAESGQNIAQAVYLLKDILTRQKPKLVVLETDELYGPGRQVLSDAVFTHAIPLLYNHSNWKHFKPKQINKPPKYSIHRKNKGFWPTDACAPYTGPEYMRSTNGVEPFSKSTALFLKIFVRTCKNNKINVMLVHLPSAINWNKERSNFLSNYAYINKINFVDLDTEKDKIKFDYSSDFRDGGLHLNTKGADKCTLEIGNFIKAKYELNDFRNDRDFTSWNDDYVNYPHNAEGRN